MIADLQRALEEFIWGKRLDKVGPPGRIVAIILRYLYAVIRDFFSGQLTMRAMSLVYTTLLSVVPLLAFSFAILKGLGKFEDLEPYLQSMVGPYLGPQGAEMLDQLLVLVDNVRGSVLGGVGLAFFLWTAISMVQKVEEAFNYTWYVSKPRNFSRRFTEYMIVLMVGPLLMVTAIGMLTSIQSNTVVQWIITNEALGPVFVLVGKLVPYLIISGVFTFLYMFVPNSHVEFKSALVGGVAGGFMWATISAIFTTVILVSSRTLAIYAGFAVAITTLIWLYLNWLVLLIGAQLAFYHQQPAFLRTGRQEPRLSNTMRERIALNIMLEVGKAHRNPGQSVTAQDISQRIRIPTIAVAPIIAALEDNDLLRSTEDEELVPGMEMARTRLADVLDVVRLHGETGSLRKPSWAKGIGTLGDELDDAIASVVKDRTLSDLLDEIDPA